MLKKFSLILLSICLILSAIPYAVSAAYLNDYAGGMAGDGSGIYAHGIDLSEWQGGEVDFNKVKEQGYSFVILRAGFASTIDEYFEANYVRAKDAGLDVGVYLYSYADNESEAQQEAQAIKGWLSGKTLEYPVYYDLEDPECHGDMRRELLTEIAMTFLDEMASDGWLVGLYSCKSWLESKMDTAEICETYECWMAQFVSSGTYEIYDRYDEVYGMWQYSCTGTVEGVPGGVDMNVCFKDYPGICRQYGFNGYEPSDESLILSGVSAPALLVQGESLSISGKVRSTKGNLTNVTVGIYSLGGQILTGRSAGPKATSFDLSNLSSGIRAQELEEGSYIYRISAGNSYESRILLNQPLIISKSGVYASDAVLPDHLKRGERFYLSGTVLSATPMDSISLQILSQKGDMVLHLQAQPEGTQYDLSLFETELSSLAVGQYRLVVEAMTETGTLCPVDTQFYVWAANDPIILEQFQLQSEYFPGELTGLTGLISSARSAIRQLDIEILDSEGQYVTKLLVQPGKQQVKLSDYEQRLRLDTLTIGVYRIRISALNEGGPQVLLDRRLLIREDGLSLCGFVPPHSIRIQDSFFLQGAVCSDVTMLTYVGVSVIDGAGKTVLSGGAVPRGNLYDLSDLSGDLLFSALPCGSYRLQLTAENESGGAILYDAAFCVVDHTDIVTWLEPCLDPRGIAYPQTSGYSVNGTLSSAVSPIQRVRVEILDQYGQVFSCAELSPGSQSVSLDKCNELLRFSALPEGTYTLRIEAVNASDSFEMLCSRFYVCQCGHSSVRSGTVLQPGCDFSGAVTDSRCTECGKKVRSGFLLEPLGHSDENGSCTRCGKAGFVTVTAESCEDPPTAFERYVIAVCDEENWYALSSDGTTVPIPSPDELGQVSVSAKLLWSFEVRSQNVFYIREPLQKLLHLDSDGLKTARGNQNAELCVNTTENGFIISLASDPIRYVLFADGQFSVAEEATELVLFRFVP